MDLGSGFLGCAATPTSRSPPTPCSSGRWSISTRRSRAVAWRATSASTRSSSGSRCSFFSVQVSAGVAVLAFGRRLASVSLRFTLEGPGAWHAFGTGSISVLWWDVDLDFDVRWGTPPRAHPGRLPRSPTRSRPLSPARTSWAAGSALHRPLADPAGALGTPVRSSPGRPRAAGVRAAPVAAGRAARRRDQPLPPLASPADLAARQGAAEPPQPGAAGRKVTARFVPGEFFTLSDQEAARQPGVRGARAAAPSSPTPSCIRTTSRAAESATRRLRGRRRVVPARSPVIPRYVIATQPSSALEAFARPLTGAERVGRWRLEQLSVNQVPLVRLQ